MTPRRALVALFVLSVFAFSSAAFAARPAGAGNLFPGAPYAGAAPVGAFQPSSAAMIAIYRLLAHVTGGSFAGVSGPPTAAPEQPVSARPGDSPDDPGNPGIHPSPVPWPTGRSGFAGMPKFGAR